MAGEPRSRGALLCAVLSVGAAMPVLGAASAGVDGRHTVVRVHSGTIAAHVNWVTDPDTADDALRGRIEYVPTPDRVRACRSIRFVQIARVRRDGGSDYEWTLAESDRNFLRTPDAGDSGITGGYYVDHRAAACTFERPCSPYFRDSWANPHESQDGFQRGRITSVASLVDYPYGWDTIEQISLESCARCVDSGAFLGCADWGARWPRQGPRDIAPIQVHERPSETFLAALNRFEAFYAVRSSQQRMVRASR